MALEDLNGGTKMVLVHSGFPNKDGGEMARQGWN
ncbi:MAG: SRPBCC domain-containing protein [Euryarchaeota archaeon]|nr:SRPBCC domain-containing protein [Euryarchaeota archaeon]